MFGQKLVSRTYQKVVMTAVATSCSHELDSWIDCENEPCQVSLESWNFSNWSVLVASKNILLPMPLTSIRNGITYSFIGARLRATKAQYNQRYVFRASRIQFQTLQSYKAEWWTFSTMEGVWEREQQHHLKEFQSWSFVKCDSSH